MRSNLLQAGAFLAAAMAISGNAQGGTIVGGSDLLSAAGLAQLETWLGQGPLTVTNIFDKAAGDTPATFHAAADGMGRTFTLFEVTASFGATLAAPVIVGGYNPSSWDSSTFYRLTPVGDRDGFIFNLSAGVVLHQDPTSAQGIYQTYNEGTYGPSFGGGFDLGSYLTLDYGYSAAYSYGLENDGATQGSVIAGGTYSFYCYVSCLTFGQIEVFTIALGSAGESVPEPASLALLGFGLAGLGLVRRRPGRVVPRA